MRYGNSGCLCLTTLLAAGVFIGFIQGCAPAEEDNSCSVSGAPVNIGSTTGGTFSQEIGNRNFLFLDNTNLNFTAQSYNSVTGAGTLGDAGTVGCLDSIKTVPSAMVNVIAYNRDHGYVIHFADDTYARFIAINYSGGSASIEYEYPFTPQ